MERRVQPPAIALLVASSLTFFLNLASLALTIFGYSIGSIFGGGPDINSIIGGTFSILFGAVALAAQAFVFFAALKLMRLENYTIALVGSIAAMVPFFPCCCLEAPLGIWALVVLLMPDTKTAFTS